MKGKCEYWGLGWGYSDPQILYRHPVRIVGRCNIKQFIQATELLSGGRTVNLEIDARKRMKVIQEKYEGVWELDSLYGCPLGTIFAYYKKFYDEYGCNPHLEENIYGVVTFD